MGEGKEEATKKRAAARGWVTRQSTALKDLLDKPSISEFELRSAIETFDRRLNTLDERQAELELLVDDGDLDQCVDEADSFRRASQENWLRANEKLQELMKASQIELGSVGSTSTSGKSPEVKLPKLELPKFKGDVTEWVSFWDQFSSHIDDTEIPVISKFTYLVSLLEGEAKSVVQGLSHTSANYSIACDLLKERYNRPERIIFAHVQSLLSGHVLGKAKGPKYVTQLWSLRDEILTHIRSLEALGVSGKQCKIFLTPIILSRLPNEIRLEWARKGAGHESDLDWLLTFLRQEIESIEKSEAFKDVTAGKRESLSSPEEKKNWQTREPKGKVSSAAALHTSSEGQL
ncbi:uncharacterized protein LOC126992176 [Eriocheir sinensis]|uniref:uncharacterized protein LOC126992176 n=1 Tax=Eriocheir sinensis TaxID=95602 RepID=UPI0021C78F2A|nr:uncharacterized protein LOC126992176 [Eriocheir sinensis]